MSSQNIFRIIGKRLEGKVELTTPINDVVKIGAAYYAVNFEGSGRAYAETLGERYMGDSFKNLVAWTRDYQKVESNDDLQKTYEFVMTARMDERIGMFATPTTQIEQTTIDYSSRPVYELEIGARGRHCMNVLGIKSIGDLVTKTEGELMTVKNFGGYTLSLVKKALAEKGLRLKE